MLPLLRVPGERRRKFYVARIDNSQRVQARLSPVFDDEDEAHACLTRIRREGRKAAVLVEETLTRFIHGLE